jgi:muramoyltetrapeptide carboxypeptidase
MNNRISIIRPSSREASDLLSGRIDELTAQGWDIEFDEMPIERMWPFTSASIKERSLQLNEALLSKDSDIIWAARGGYGASDLLDLIPWDDLSKLPHAKLLIGFSDTCALHSAVYTKLRWPGLHAPMPATLLWRKDPSHNDVDQVLDGLRSGEWHIKQAMNPTQHYLPSDDFKTSGTLFGGCLSVLTNLIGTPYFPKSLKNHILFFEDTGENPGRLARMMNQWRQAGVLEGVNAIILGDFRDCCEPGKEEPYLYRMFAQRSGLPTFVSGAFGHTSPNLPMMIGAKLSIQADGFAWDFKLRGSEA